MCVWSREYVELVRQTSDLKFKMSEKKRKTEARESKRRRILKCLKRLKRCHVRNAVKQKAVRRQGPTQSAWVTADYLVAMSLQSFIVCFSVCVCSVQKFIICIPALPWMIFLPEPGTISTKHTIQSNYSRDPSHQRKANTDPAKERNNVQTQSDRSYINWMSERCN